MRVSNYQLEVKNKNKRALGLRFGVMIVECF